MSVRVLSGYWVTWENSGKSGKRNGFPRVSCALPPAVRQVLEQPLPRLNASSLENPLELRQIVAQQAVQLSQQADRISQLELKLAKAKEDSCTSSKPLSSDIELPEIPVHVPEYRLAVYQDADGQLHNEPWLTVASAWGAVVCTQMVVHSMKSLAAIRTILVGAAGFPLLLVVMARIESREEHLAIRVIDILN